MSRPDIDAIKARLGKATPGPWEALSHGTMPDGKANPQWLACGFGSIASNLTKETAQLIANAPTDLAALIAYVESLEAECEARGAILDEIRAAAGLDRRAGWRASIEVLTNLSRVRPLDEYHEDFGPVLWWKLPVEEPPWCGTPNDSDWPGYQTHWSPLPKLALDEDGMPKEKDNG